jgi:hypothetical protein
VVVTGRSIVIGSYDGYYTAKYAAADGALLWEKRYNGNGSAAAVAVDRSNNVVVTGDSGTIKYLANGEEVWANGAVATALAVDGSGNVVVTRSSYNANSTNPDYYTAKYAAADGALLWEKRYDGAEIEGFYLPAVAVAVDSSGNVVVTGSSGGFESRASYTAKYAAADGTLLWEIRYSGPANANNFVGGNDSWLGSRGLALGPNGMVAITGSSGGDYATVVYRETLPPLAIERVPTGIRLRFTGVPGSSYTIERALAVTGPWTTLNTQPAPASGLLEYLDANPAPGSAFFRTSAP